MIASGRLARPRNILGDITDGSTAEKRVETESGTIWQLWQTRCLLECARLRGLAVPSRTWQGCGETDMARARTERNCARTTRALSESPA